MASPAAHLDITHTFGAMFIGALVTMSIYGITTLQTYFYYTYYPKDAYSVKTLVATIWILDTLHVILMCHCMYFYLISGFGNPEALVNGTCSNIPSRSLYASLAVNVTMAFLVQCYFTKRIYALCSQRWKWWLSGIIAFSVIAHFCFGMETVVFFFIKKQFARLKDLNYISVLPFAITAILSDILIAAALCLLLATNRSEYEDTNSIINKLIVYAINRCILTSAVAVIEVVIFVAIPHSFYSFAFDFIIGKLYANSLLATLNSRRSLRMRDDSSRATSTSFRLASVATRDEPDGLVHVASRDSTPEGRRRIHLESEGIDRKFNTMATYSSNI